MMAEEHLELNKDTFAMLGLFNALPEELKPQFPPTSVTPPKKSNKRKIGLYAGAITSISLIVIGVLLSGVIH